LRRWIGKKMILEGGEEGNVGNATCND